MLSPIMDMGGILFLFIGLPLGALIFLIASSFIEGAILNNMGWGSKKYCFWLSALVNTISLVAGIFLPIIVSDIGSNSLSTSHEKFMVSLFLLITFLCTYVVEATILYLFGRKKHSAKRILITALYTNLISYGLLILILLMIL